jgi:hypothetical protein
MKEKFGSWAMAAVAGAGAVEGVRNQHQGENDGHGSHNRKSRAIEAKSAKHFGEKR